MTAAASTASGITIGVRSGTWRATVDGSGTIRPSDRSAPLGWWVAAEDRWHHPGAEPSVRQRRLEGTPVVETRLRVPGGDVVQRVYATADAGGVTVVEFHNDSPAAVVVAVSHRQLLTPPGRTPAPIEGIDLPATAVAYPVGHHATLRLGLAHDGRLGELPASVAEAGEVAAGWLRHVEPAARLELPDAAFVDAVVASRCEACLGAVPDRRNDAAALLLATYERVRLGSDAAEAALEMVGVAEGLIRSARRCGLDWLGAAGLAATEAVLAASGDGRGAADVADVRARLGADGAPLAVDAPEGMALVAWAEWRLARPLLGRRCQLLAGGLPADWLGANFEVHHLPAGPSSWVSYALRWHGARPAVLWEVTGDPVTLIGGPSAPEWSSDERRGEALWPEPAR
jgi:hypothetical protein